MKIVSLTDIGQERDSNQDNFSLGKLSGSACYIIVCDGMGGRNGGAQASKMTIEYIEKRIRDKFKESMSDDEIRGLLLSCAYMANEEVFGFSQDHKEVSGMGTTLVATIVKGNTAHIINVGDSRAYLLASHQVEQITKDHSMVQVLLDSGQITSEEAQEYPNKNIITRAVGIDDLVDVDYFVKTMKKGDTLLLCTDGFSGYITDNKLLEIFNDTEFENLAQTAVDYANNAGGKDNITVIALQL